MPRDDSAPAAAVDGNEANSSGPLKRGDACLYCRRRRIKCSATKPSCTHCTKLRRECVYDSGKPVSRVKQLEEKVAELEGMIKTGGDAPPIPKQSSSTASTASLTNPAAPSPTSYALPAASLQQPAIDIHMLESYGAPSDQSAALDFDSFFPTYGNSTFGQTQQQSYNPGISTSIPPPSSNAGTSAEPMFDFSTLDPNFMSLIDSFQNTSTGPMDQLQQPVSNFAYDGIKDNQNGVPSFVDPNIADPPFEVPVSHPGYISPNQQSLSEQSAANRGFISPDQQSLNGRSTANRGFISPDRQSLSSSMSAGQNTGRAPSATSIPYQAYVSDIPTEPEQRDLETDMRIPTIIGISGDHPVPSEAGVKELMNQIALHDNQYGRNGPQVNGMESGMVGGWFDPADLPRVARDHLLDLFFSGMRLFGQEIHVPRFYASLSMPASKRPHPCLLYAMYLLASRISTSQPIRSLETHFYSIASRQLEESISHADRLFDAVRAASMLAVYKYSLARYHEGWMMTGQAARLAVSCGLHQIPSNVFKRSNIPEDYRADLTVLLRGRTYVIGAPRDSIELGERIWAFWSIFFVDRAGAISSFYPPAMPDEVIITPYPRPLSEYSLGIVTEADDVSLSSLYEPRLGPGLPHYSEATGYILRVRSMALLERSSKLIYLKPEPGWRDRARETYGMSPGSGSGTFASPPGWSDDGNSVAMVSGGNSPAYSDNAQNQKAGRGWMRTARIRTPRAYEEVRQALLRVEEDLPPERKTRWERWDGKVQDWHFQQHRSKKDLFTLHFVIGCAWLFLFDVFSFNARNDEAVAVARRLVVTIRMAASELLGSDFTPFIAMTWSFVVKILIREAKRLRSINDPSVMIIEADVDAIVQALKVFGSRHNIADLQAKRADRYRKSTLDDMEFLRDETPNDENVGFTWEGL